MRRSFVPLAAALGWACLGVAQIPPGQVIFYPNGIGFINDQGIPEYQSFYRPKKKSPPKRIRSIPLGNVTLYPHGMGFINSHGIPEYRPYPGGITWDRFCNFLFCPATLLAGGPQISTGITPQMAPAAAPAAQPPVPPHRPRGRVSKRSKRGQSVGLGSSSLVGRHQLNPSANCPNYSALMPVMWTLKMDSNPSSEPCCFRKNGKTDRVSGVVNQLTWGYRSYSSTPEWNSQTGTITDIQTGISLTTGGPTSINGFGVQMGVTGTLIGGMFNGTGSITYPGETAATYSLAGSAVNNFLPAACSKAEHTEEPVAMNNGEYLSDPEPDLDLGGPLPLFFQRHYGTLLKANGTTGALGDNWTHNFETRAVVGDKQPRVLLAEGATIEFMMSGNTWVPVRSQELAYQFAPNGSNYQFLDARTNLIYTFNAGGALTRIEDRNGNALTIAQSAQGPTQISDGLGRTLTLAYTPAGSLASIKDQTGRTVSFTSTGGVLTSVTDANGGVTTYNYTTAAGRTGMMTSTKLPAGNTTLTQNFDQDGRVSRQLDALNNATTFAYDPPPGAGTVTDALGNKSQNLHTDLQNVNQEVDANGKATTTVYDAAIRPVQITDRLGGRTILAYDPASGLETSRTDPSGNVETAVYTAQKQGLVTFYVTSKLTYADGASSSYQYDANGNVLSETDQAGKVTQYTYNKQGQVLTESNASGGVTTYAYNSDGTVASVTTPAGDKTQYGYDAQKRLAKVTYADGTSEAFTYDARDQLVQHSPAAGAPETFAYDSNGNLRSYTDLSGATTTFTYDANDRPVSVKDGAGATTAAVYDAVGRATTLSNGAGEQTTISYDPVGQPVKILDGAGNAQQLVWSAEGFQQSATDALGRSTAYLRDTVGRILTETSALGEKTSYTYDKMGRLASAATALGRASKFSYDARGGLARVDLPAGISATYTYDDLGNLAGMTDPNGGAWTNTYDNLGRLTGVADPLGQSTSIQYDSRNRASGASNAAGSVNFTYDALGNLTESQYGDGTDLKYQYAPGSRLISGDNLALAYDARGRIISSNGIAVTRDGAGRITTVTYGPGLVVTYKYNSVGLLAEVDDWVGGATKLQYDAAHRLAAVQRPNGTAAQYVRDANGRVINKIYTTADGTYSFKLTRDAEGNIVGSDRNVPLSPQPPAGFIGYSYDAAHQVAGAGYDAAGRILSDALRAYAWDLASRLASYSGADGAAQFTYDGLGLRVSRATADGEQDYVWNYAHTLPALAIVRSGGADLRYYVYLPGGSLMHSIEAADGSRHFYHFDETGSTAFLTDDSGSVSDAYGITPFGESVTQAGATDNPFTFHGAFGVMQEGSTSLYYMRARYYDSASGRFLSRDPMVSLDPLRINPYQFALNNPVGFADATGKKAAEPQGANSFEPGTSLPGSDDKSIFVTDPFKLIAALLVGYDDESIPAPWYGGFPGGPEW
jgi:RHS repeat-associated protein